MRHFSAFLSPLVRNISPKRGRSRPICTASASERCGPNAAYIHLPFCKQKCAYCSFPIVVQSARTSGQTAEDKYLSLLFGEIRANARAFEGQHRPLTSVYLGGGTPSLTSVAGIEKLLTVIDDAFGIESGCEITCEMDPATFDLQKAKSYRQCGVTRASIGAQSFDDALLETCRRVHREADIFDAVGWLRDAKFDNLSLDLISGLPGQTLATWEGTLEKAIGLLPEHISTYDLELDEGTPFGNMYRPGTAPLPSEDTAADMLKTTSKMLRSSGYLHYEVSNYAKDDSRRSRHNLNYWANDNFFAFGLGATSLVAMDAHTNAIRFARPRSMVGYEAYVDHLSRETCRIDTRPNGDILFPGAAPRDEEEFLEDWLINAVRLLDEGICFERLRKDFGERVASRVATACEQSGLVERGLITMVYESNSSGNPSRMLVSEAGFIFESSILSTILSNAVWNYATSLQ